MPIISDDVARRLGLSVDRFEPANQVDAPCSVRVTVDNRSNVSLDSKSDVPLHLAYHWLDADSGEMTVWDGLRTKIVPPTIAQSRRSYEMRVITPSNPGKYRFRAALVQEHVRWLDDLVTTTIVPTVVSVERRPWWTAEIVAISFTPPTRY
jgi:hypothetical protein